MNSTEPDRIWGIMKVILWLFGDYGKETETTIMGSEYGVYGDLIMTRILTSEKKHVPPKAPTQLAFSLSIGIFLNPKPKQPSSLETLPTQNGKDKNLHSRNSNPRVQGYCC